MDCQLFEEFSKNISIRLFPEKKGMQERVTLYEFSTLRNAMYRSKLRNKFLKGKIPHVLFSEKSILTFIFHLIW